jgi:hypothetical protein
MYACGLRIGEATTLEVTAVDGANLILHIIGILSDVGSMR